MRNVGEIPRFEVGGGPGTYAYVFSWWDHSVDAIGTNHTRKQLNVGGDPTDSFQVRYACEVVDYLGQSVELLGALIVNNPPYIPGTNPPSITHNDEEFPFATQFHLKTCDFEEHGVPFAYWYDNTAHLGPGVQSISDMHPVGGTYDNRLVGYFRGTTYSLDYTVDYDGTVSVILVDGDAGTTQVDFLVRGYEASDPFLSPAIQPASLIVDASNLPRQVIYPGAVVELGAYSGISTVTPVFTWEFQPVNGWLEHEVVNYIEPVPQANGAWSGTYSKDVSNEEAGEKVVRLSIAIGAASSQVSIPVTLVANEIPGGLTVSIRQGNTLIPTDYTVAAGDKLNYLVTATDPNQELTYAAWVMILGSITEYFVGNKIFIDTTGLSGKTITGQVTVYDIHDFSATTTVSTVYVT